jgi:copper chaperone CopZ
MKPSFLYTILLAFALTTSLQLSAQALKEQSTPTSQKQKLQTVKLKVSGISCSGDCKDIQKVVGKLNGVSDCKQLGKPSATSVFEVTFDPAVVTEKEIRSKVEDTPGCDNPKEKPYKVKQG